MMTFGSTIAKSFSSQLGRRAKWLVITFFAAVLCWTDAVWAQTAPQVTTLGSVPPRSYMWIGSSFFYYNNGMTGHVTQLARGETGGGPTHRATLIAISGSGLDWHDVESYFRPNAIGSYVFDDSNNIVFDREEKKYDAVIMMDCSQCPIHPQLAPVFFKTVKQDAGIVRAHGALPVLFMSWAYLDHPEMTAPLAQAYTQAGNANGALVIPAGLAFARVLKARPDLKLYMPDKRHPTLIGTYLAAATVYGALYGRSPEANTYTAGIDPDLAQFLRAESWATVRDYMAGSIVN